MQQDIATQLQQQVREALKDQTALDIRGGATKVFYGNPVEGRPIEVGAHRGVVNYQPTELVITARAGTPLAEIEETLAGHRQMLGFEPPHYGSAATLGGTIACNLSGPQRPVSGAARDFVLGCRLLNGKGEILSFGGEVMKNVAGYDISRLMAGSLGTLAILLEVSLKVVPVADSSRTVVLECEAADALARMHAWSRRPLPISATCHDGAALYARLSGTDAAIRAAHRQIGGDEVPDSQRWWRKIREHEHGFFAGDRPLWRLSLPSTAPQPSLTGKWLIEWGGAQRWLRSDESVQRVRTAAAAAGGHAVAYRGGGDVEVFQPLPVVLERLQRRIKQAFDPGHILNPGRMYRNL